MATLPRFINRLQPSSSGDRSQRKMLSTQVTETPARVDSMLPLPKEPEDARLTGGTRSLDRRLLALNLAGSLVKSAFGKPELLRSKPASEHPVPPLRTAAA